MKKCLIVAGGAVSASLLKKIFREGEFAYVFAVDRGLEALDVCGIRPTHLVGDFDSAAPEVLEKYLPHPAMPDDTVMEGQKTVSGAEYGCGTRKNVTAIGDATDGETLTGKCCGAGGKVHARADYPALERLIPEKDDTDTEHAMRRAVSLHPDEIALLGGFGTRFDHVLANVHTLTIPLRAGIPACMVDETNRLRLLEGKGGCSINGENAGDTDAELRIKKSDIWGRYVSLLPLTTEVAGITLEGFKYPLADGKFKIGETVSLGVSNELAGEEGAIRVKEGILIVTESADAPVL